MKSAIFLFALLSLPHPEAQTSDATKPSCSESNGLLVDRNLPAPVSKAHYKRAPEELEISGTVVPSGGKMPVLADDSYLFIVVNLTGRPGEEIVVYGVRAPEPVAKGDEEKEKPDPGFVATHLSLVRQLSRELGESEEKVSQAVYASGEFQTVSGSLHQVSNASPFFRSGKEQLDYSVSVLDSKMAKWLPGAPTAVLADKKSNTFATEKALALTTIQNRLDAKKASMRDDLVMLIAQLANKIPLNGTRAGIDEQRLQELRKHYLESFPKAQRKAHDFEPLIPLVLVSRGKGVDFAVEEFCKSRSGACFDEFDGYFKNFISAIGVYGLRLHKFTD